MTGNDSYNKDSSRRFPTTPNASFLFYACNNYVFIICCAIFVGCLGGAVEPVDLSTPSQKVDIRFGEKEFTFLKNRRVGKWYRHACAGA
jgi:hypothetical protein